MEERMTERRMRRIGQWTYHDDGATPGWRLDDTQLVLDFDPLDRSGPLRGVYILYRDGRYDGPVDHYLKTAMEWVECEHAGEVPHGE
jgi:hypothetical protein